MPALVKLGSRGLDVVVVQIQLNRRLTPCPNLVTDGIFGPLTRAAVIAFQRQARLSADGIVGPMTHAALAQGVTLTFHNHAMTLIPQPTQTTCWAASTAMMTRSNVMAVRAKTPASMIASDGGLLNSSESDQAVVTGTAYGNIHGLRCHAPMSWTVSGLMNRMRGSPLMFDMLWEAGSYVQGLGSPGHMVVTCAAVTDGNADGKGTALRILDPWPPNVGKDSWVQFAKWMEEVPTRTYRVFERK